MKKLFVVLPLVILTGVGFGLYSWWHSPATSSIDSGTQEVSNVLGSETSLKSWQTSYFVTSMPSSLRIKTSNDALESGNYLLTSKTPRISDQIGVTVAKLGNNSLNELPAVKLRLNQPNIYAAVANTYAPAASYSFVNEATYETSVFWQEDGYYAAVVASGTSARRAELNVATRAIVSNWSWR
ncbi:hypothetical protein H7097_04445 [Aeromicrobium sp.]|nr:hypothetical protein [Candidatus Saccharibacteria bacterium]